MPQVLGYRVRVVDHHLVKEGIRSAAHVDHDKREILVSSVVPSIDQLAACVMAGARLESLRHPDSIPVVPLDGASIQ
jgi:hypothetical protein